MSVTWTDEALRRAVAAARSWRGVARSLGLKGTSAGTIRALKRRAASLGLDTTHFTRQRTWSDHQLRKALASSGTWSEVFRALGLSESAGDIKVRVKGHAVRLGLDFSHLEPLRPDRPAACDLLPDITRLSRSAEPFAAAWFEARGAQVTIPSSPAPYDLLVEFGGRWQRVQVKTTTCRGRHGTWSANVGRRPYVLDKTASRVPYDPDELDYFFIIDGDLCVYLIPSSVLAGRAGINVGAYTDYRVGDASSLFADVRG